MDNEDEKLRFLTMQTLLNPFRTASFAAIGCLAISVLLGWLFGAEQFEKAGILSVLAGALTFGLTAEQIALKALVPVLLDETGQRSPPFDNKSISNVFKAEAALVAIGALQSTYGVMIWGLIEKSVPQ